MAFLAVLKLRLFKHSGVLFGCMQYSIRSQKSQVYTFSVTSSDEEPIISESGVFFSLKAVQSLS